MRGTLGRSEHFRDIGVERPHQHGCVENPETFHNLAVKLVQHPAYTIATHLKFRKIHFASAESHVRS